MVLGGGVVNGAADLLLGDIRSGVAAIAGMDFIRQVRIRASSLGSDAGLLGAATLAAAAMGPAAPSTATQGRALSECGPAITSPS